MQGREVVSKGERRPAVEESGVTFIMISEPPGRLVASLPRHLPSQSHTCRLPPDTSHQSPAASRLPPAGCPNPRKRARAKGKAAGKGEWEVKSREGAEEKWKR